MVEIITAKKNYTFYGTKEEIDKRWNGIKFIDHCILSYQDEMENAELIKAITYQNSQKLADWFNLMGTFTCSIDICSYSYFQIEFKQKLIFKSAKNPHWIPNSPSFSEWVRKYAGKIQSVSIPNYEEKVYMKFKDNKELVVIPPKIGGRSFFDIMSIKIGKYYYEAGLKGYAFIDELPILTNTM